MSRPALMVRLRPIAPWRPGSLTGDKDAVDTVYHSDTLFSALCHAMEQLGWLESWLEATVGSAEPAVRLSSLFPWVEDLLMVPPPMSHWPPVQPHRLRLREARFVPLPVAVSAVLEEPLNEEEWRVDGPSGCLVRSNGSRGPFRVRLRYHAAVDRLSGASYEACPVACLEFPEDAGFWGVLVFRDAEAQQQWEARLRGAFRLLADSGFGGCRSRGWGRCGRPEFVHGEFPALVHPRLAELGQEDSSAEIREGEPAPWHGYWLWSLFNPGATDQPDWRQSAFRILERSGRIEARSSWGTRTATLRMVAEGSVLCMSEPPAGRAVNVAPAGFPHPVWRYGSPVSLYIRRQRTP